MSRRTLLAVAIPGLLLALACGGAGEPAEKLTEPEEPGPPTARDRAEAACQPALENTAEYEEVPPVDGRAESLCVGWYGRSATEDELLALECMAGALDEVAWEACRAPFAHREEVKRNRFGIIMEPGDMEPVALELRVAEAAGLLGALRDGSELDGVFGSSGLDSELSGGIGGLIGAKGIEIGSGGLGSRGSGLGGGGTAEGLGGLGTKGRGSGASGYGSGGGHFGSAQGGSFAAGTPLIEGPLDSSLVEAVVKRHANQLRYCYQRVLTKEPDLSGKIVVKFVIAADGSVSSAEVQQTTMNNASVEGCVTGRFLRFLFPKPEGGGIVTVTYPFIFRPAE